MVNMLLTYHTTPRPHMTTLCPLRRQCVSRCSPVQSPGLPESLTHEATRLPYRTWHWNCSSCLTGRVMDAAGDPQKSGEVTMDEHPKGALTFMLIYLAFITLIW